MLATFGAQSSTRAGMGRRAHRWSPLTQASGPGALMVQRTMSSWTVSIFSAPRQATARPSAGHIWLLGCRVLRVLVLNLRQSVAHLHSIAAAILGEQEQVYAIRNARMSLHHARRILTHAIVCGPACHSKRPEAACETPPPPRQNAAQDPTN